MGRARLGSTVPALVALLAACGPSVIESTPADALGRSTSTFEEYKARLPRDPIDGAWLVEGDIAVHDEAQLRSFHEDALSGSALAINRVNGVDDRWSTAQQLNVTYCVSPSFGTNHGMVVAAIQGAMDAWQAAANVRYTYLPTEDINCNASNLNVTFDVRPVSGTTYNARAFFPSSPRAQRNILIDLANALNAAPKTLMGILKHELGHTLGFRHEHTRDASSWCYEDANWRALTDYDGKSAMHYLQCPGSTSTSDYDLTGRDRIGVASIYGRPPGGVRLRHEADGQCLYNDDPRDGGQVRHYGCWADTNMVYYLDPLPPSEGVNAVRLRHWQSQSCIYGNGTDGGMIYHWSCWNDPNMVYLRTDFGSNRIRLRNRTTGKCLYTFGGNGSTTHNYTCWDDPNMVFVVEAAN